YLTGTHTWPSWLSDYPLHISERFSINSSGVLVIEAGVRLELTNPISYPPIRIYGTLNTLGTTNNPVVFTRQTGIANWGYMSFEGMSGGRLDYTIIEYGSGIGIESSDVQIANSIIRYSKYSGISINNASPEISDSVVTDNDQVGIRINRGSSIISGCIIVNNDSYGIDIDYASPTVSGCTIAYNGDNGIDVFDSGSGSGENSSPIISGCSIANNNGIGIDLSGIQLVDSLPVVSGNTISSNADYAVRVKVDKLSTAFANANTFSENGEDAVYVLANGQYLTGTHTWPSWLSDYPLHISERFSINSSGVLVIEAGVRL
ncbi:MAG: right-handed parallel beta-helix repeat-containing protein, partial [candidate division Zixibacteria bacterium]|nr:right-handed parallel beta-helix repeat-containing protein [candidate division Zixibacteria bacterium]